jgi:hypothetical protein
LPDGEQRAVATQSASSAQLVRQARFHTRTMTDRDVRWKGAAGGLLLEIIPGPRMANGATAAA